MAVAAPAVRDDRAGLIAQTASEIDPGRRMFRPVAPSEDASVPANRWGNLHEVGYSVFKARKPLGPFGCGKLGVGEIVQGPEGIRDSAPDDRLRPNRKNEPRGGHAANGAGEDRFDTHAQ